MRVLNFRAQIHERTVSKVPPPIKRRGESLKDKINWFSEKINGEDIDAVDDLKL